MARGTTKPCPGCGAEVWHEIGSVCFDCRTILSKVRELAERVDGLKGEADAKPYRLSSVDHWNPYLYVGRDFKGSREYQTLIRDLGLAAAEVVLPIDAVPAKRTEELLAVKRESYDSGARDILMIDERLALAIRAMDTWVREQFVAAYEAGKKEGGSILLALANGDSTLDGYTKALEDRRSK